MANEKEQKQLIWAMNLSLFVGFAILVFKLSAFVLTGSISILGDASESIIHVLAVSFASYSIRYAALPPDEDHQFGHAKISYISAGFEGILIGVAGLYIIYESIDKLIYGIDIDNPGWGLGLIVFATLVNAFLGFYLVRKGKEEKSIILEANGKHVLTDVWTSFGAIIGIFLVTVTGWHYWDPILAIIVAINILWASVHLLKESYDGIVDKADPEVDKIVRESLDEEMKRFGLKYHGLRHRRDGVNIWLEFHLLFEDNSTIKDAHDICTKIEDKIDNLFSERVFINTHLEPMDAHDKQHPEDQHA